MRTLNKEKYFILFTDTGRRFLGISKGMLNKNEGRSGI